MITEAIDEIGQERNQPRLRANPRVLKRAVTYYPPKRAKHAYWPQPTKHPDQAIFILK